MTEPRGSKKRKAIHLTLSAIIESDSGALRKIAGLRDVTAEHLTSLGVEFWSCPNDRLHISMLNFCSLDYSDFDEARRRLERSDWYPWFIEYVEQKILPTLTEERFEIRRFYTKDVFKNSLALNAFPTTSRILNQLREIEDEARKYLSELNMPLYKFGVKSYKEDYEKYFAINILRFESPFSGEAGFSKYINQQNETLKQEPIVFNFSSARLVISDPYLSNENFTLLPR